MAWDFSINNYAGAWSIVVQLGLILVFLFLGNMIRRVVPFLRKAYIPSALIGGLLLLLLNIFLKNVCHVKLPGMEAEGVIDQNVMQTITYHALAIGFIAMTLKVNKRENKKDGLGLKSIQNGFLTGATYMLQAVFGILTILVFVWAGKAIFYDAGVILPLGFGQGPGNALTWDNTFSDATKMADIVKNGELWKDSLSDPAFVETLKSEGKILGTNGSFGLSIASIGFIVASVVGVLYINIFRRKGQIGRETVELGSRQIAEFVEHNEIEDNESVDKLSIQVAIVAVAYALTFGIMTLLSLIDKPGKTFVTSIAFGFNFIFGVISATIVKTIFVFLKKKNIIHRKYINNYQMDRISGFAFDIMIIAGVAAIEINDIKGFILPIIALSIVGTVVTYLYVRLITRFVFKGYEHEMFLTNFGTLTGTASNGMILLREIDPSYKTPASDIFVVSQFPAMVAVAPLLLLLNFTAKSQTHTYISLGIFGLLFILYTVFIIVSTYISRPSEKRHAKKVK